MIGKGLKGIVDHLGQGLKQKGVIFAEKSSGKHLYSVRRKNVRPIASKSQM